MKFRNILLGATMLMSLTCCAGTGNKNDKNPVEENKDTFEIGEMYERVWETKTIHNESIMMCEDDTGAFSGRLLYKPTKVLSVKSQSLEITYIEGVDYKVEDDKIVLLNGSSIPHFTKENLNMNDIPEGFTASNKYEGKEPGTSIIFTEGSELLTRQIAVTYEHNSNWFGTVPTKKGDKLELLRYKLTHEESLTSVTFGDSIFCGCNTSGLFGIAPNQAPFPTGFASELERRYGCHIDHTNKSHGGDLSNNGVEKIMEVNNLNPDLVILGFGMNDGSWNVSETDYIDNIEFMIKSLQANNSDVSIIVCATILASQVSPQSKGRQESYLPYLLELENNYDNLAVLDMTTFSKDIQTRKSSLDLYSNNINHPCDWLARQYVANLMYLLEVNK